MKYSWSPLNTEVGAVWGLHPNTESLYWSGTSQDQVIQQREYNVRELMINNDGRLREYPDGRWC